MEILTIQSFAFERDFGDGHPRQRALDISFISFRHRFPLLRANVERLSELIQCLEVVLLSPSSVTISYPAYDCKGEN